MKRIIKDPRKIGLYLPKDVLKEIEKEISEQRKVGFCIKKTDVIYKRLKQAYGLKT